MRRAFFAATSAAILWFYYWTASAGLPFERGARLEGYYNLLAHSLLQGRLDLPVAPPPELFELIDPYDPAKNAPYRLHDVSLYQGRYYLYFGIAPALTLFAPARLLGLGDLPEGLAALVFCIGGFLFAVRLLLHLTPGETPFWMQGLGTLALGLVNVAPFILRGPESYSVYHVAIAAGYCFVMGAAYFLATGRLALGSLLLGLAVASRPNQLFAVPLLLLAGPRLRERWGLFRALGPFALCLVLIGLYNRARFDSWTEFGVRYQLAGSHVQKLDTFDSRSLLPGAFFYFLSPPRFGSRFPFVSPDPRYPGRLPPGYYGPEPIVGVVAHAPFLAILLGARSRLRRAPSLRTPVLVLTGIGVLSALVASFVFPSATMRYEVDFISFLLVPALLLWYGAAGAARGLFPIPVAYALLVNVALSFTGYGEGPAPSRSEDSAGRETTLGPLPAIEQGWPPHDTRAVVRMRVAFPERLSTEREPLLSVGADVLYVRDQQGQPVLGWRDAEVPVSLRPNVFYALAADLDRTRNRVLVRLDGKDAAALPGPSGPVRRDGTWLGRGPKGDERWSRFSGAMVSEFQSEASPRGFEWLPEISREPAIVTDTPPPQPSLGQLWVRPRVDGARLFDGVAWRWIARPTFDRIRVERRIEIAGGRKEPESFLVSGGDAVRLYPVGRRVCVGFDSETLGLRPGPRSEPFTPGTYTVRVILDRPGRLVRVSLDGREMLRVTTDLGPLLRAQLVVGPVTTSSTSPSSQ